MADQSKVDAEFWRWLEPHWVSMGRAAARYGGVDASDVLSDAVLLAQRKRHLYDPEKGSAAGWLVAITRDAAGRRRRRAALAEISANPTVVSPDDAHRSDRWVDVGRAVARLPARQREAIYLHYLVDLSVDDVAVALGCSSGAVKSALHHGRAALARHLEEGYER